MRPIYLVRLALDLTAVVLLIAGLAYYWLDNLSHELIGTAMFVLLIVHGVFNRRWYGGILKGRYDSRRTMSAAINLSFLTVMLVLLVSSIMVSRSLFAFLSLESFTAREIHKLAAYWAVAILGIHLGLHWAVVMNWLRNRFVSGSSAIRAAILRAMALVMAVYGVQSTFDMALGSKLMRRATLDMWDFNEATPLFFANYLSIVGLYAVLTHYGTRLLRRDAPFRAQPLKDGGVSH